MELLLTVDNHYLIKGRGLVITPVLDCPENIPIRPFSDQVVIRHPDGDEIKLKAEFVIEAFVIDRGGGYARHIVITIPEGTKDSISVGSQVFVTRELYRYIKGDLHTNSSSINWLEPWSAINNSKYSMKIERELYIEIGKGHELFRQPLRALGRRQDMDDFLFEYGLISKLAVVHLTFSSKPEAPPIPLTSIYNDITEFIEKRMKPDHEANNTDNLPRY